jgi:hypothetical protein
VSKKFLQKKQKVDGKYYKGTQRKKEYPNLPNEKFLGVQNPFYKKGFGRRRQKLTVNLGIAPGLTKNSLLSR